MDEQEERKEKYRRLKANAEFQVHLKVFEAMLIDLEKDIDEFCKAVENDNAD